jgi:hypothetical protein
MTRLNHEIERVAQRLQGVDGWQQHTPLASLIDSAPVSEFQEYCVALCEFLQQHHAQAATLSNSGSDHGNDSGAVVSMREQGNADSTVRLQELLRSLSISIKCNALASWTPANRLQCVGMRTTCPHHHACIEQTLTRCIALDSAKIVADLQATCVLKANQQWPPSIHDTPSSTQQQQHVLSEHVLMTSLRSLCSACNYKPHSKALSNSGATVVSPVDLLDTLVHQVHEDEM